MIIQNCVYVLECVDGFYDKNCSGICGFCVNDEVCEKVSGHCLNGCTTDFKEPMCQGIWKCVKINRETIYHILFQFWHIAKCTLTLQTVFPAFSEKIVNTNVVNVKRKRHATLPLECVQMVVRTTGSFQTVQVKAKEMHVCVMWIIFREVCDSFLSPTVSRHELV